MTYDELKSIVEKNGFVIDILTKSNRVLYISSNSHYFCNYLDNVVAVVRFFDYTSDMFRITFYPKIDVTEYGLKTNDDKSIEISEYKMIDEELKTINEDIKKAIVSYKLRMINKDFEK